jgi:hypothetical protein
MKTDKGNIQLEFLHHVELPIWNKNSIERKAKVDMVLKLEDECEFYIYPFFP